MAFHVNYDSIAAAFDRRYLENDYSGVESALRVFVGGESTARVLEVGCGTGHWLRLLGEKASRVAGVDASLSMLAFARTTARHAALAQGRAEQLPWRDRTFERVFCINALHHFEDKLAFLREAHRVLVPGGQLMTVGLDPHTGTDRWYIYEYFESVLEIDKLRYPASQQIREWMHALGYSSVRTSEVQHLPVRLSTRAALEQGRLDKGVTSQLAVLPDEDYERGIERIRRALDSAEATGESLYLTADLRLHATFGSVALSPPEQAPNILEGDDREAWVIEDRKAQGSGAHRPMPHLR
jgi:ubiquinone/menaquinone biosynthesis C-methylase UbiE